HSNEPGNQFYDRTPGDPGAVFGPRTVNVVAFNDILTPTDRSVLALRYGFMRFRDDFHSEPSDAGMLGVAGPFGNSIKGFPLVTATGYGSPVAGILFNGGARTDSSFFSHSISASFSHLVGRHTAKIGGDYRRIGMDVFSPDNENGAVAFTSSFTAGPD